MSPTTYPTTSKHATGPSGADRCDRCRVRAQVRVTLPGGAELLFCSHHANEHRTALLLAGAAFSDERDKHTVPGRSGSSA